MFYTSAAAHYGSLHIAKLPSSITEQHRECSTLWIEHLSLSRRWLESLDADADAPLPVAGAPQELSPERRLHQLYDITLANASRQFVWLYKRP